MSTNNKVTSKKVSSLAAKTLNSNSASQTAKKLAGSALSQVQKGNQTGCQIEDLASKVLSGSKYGRETKTLAASVLSQANKER
jgi:hypothetical protein